MEQQQQALSLTSLALRTLDEFDQRDELLVCLDFIGSAHHEDPELINSLSQTCLAEPPIQRSEFIVNERS